MMPSLQDWLQRLVSFNNLTIVGKSRRPYGTWVFMYDALSSVGTVVHSHVRQSIEMSSRSTAPLTPEQAAPLSAQIAHTAGFPDK